MGRAGVLSSVVLGDFLAIGRLTSHGETDPEIHGEDGSTRRHRDGEDVYAQSSSYQSSCKDHPVHRRHDVHLH
jgi:hypothetical protein